MNLRNRLKRLEQHAQRTDDIAFVTLYDHAACVRRWGGRVEWMTLADALPYISDPSIKLYEASDTWNPEDV